MSVQLLSQEQRTKRNRVHDGNRPGNRTLNRRVQPEGRGFVSRLGYSNVCTSYSQDTSIDRLSGSSLCRLYSKRKKDELQKIREAEEELQAKVNGTIHAYIERREAVNDLRKNITLQRRNKNRFSDTYDRSEKRLHVLSSRSKGKVKDKATAFFRACCGKQRTFATLTFLADVDDSRAIKILNSFFTVVRKRNKDFKYLWVAERQENGNIHFHCVFNMFMDLRYYNSLWVVCQYNAGLRYFDPFSCSGEHFLPGDVSINEINARHVLGTMQEILNPFDIERVKTIYGISYYLTKYITKNKSAGFECLAWHCSRHVSRLFTKAIVSRSVVSMASNPLINFRVSRKTGEVFSGKMKQGQFHLLIYLENKVLFLQELAEMEQINKWILAGWLPDIIPEIDENGLPKFNNN